MNLAYLTSSPVRLPILVVASVLYWAGCDMGADVNIADQLAAQSGSGPVHASEHCDASQGTDIPAGLSEHFREWLHEHGYAAANFARDDLDGGSFGGLVSATDCITREPVIFVHGNSDRALGGPIGGWTASVEHFASRGYRRAELYGTTYGPADSLLSATYYHSKEYVMQIRNFIEAVLSHTGAAKVDVIAHSMGVTVARKAIKGGWARDLAAGGNYYVGEPLTGQVDTFVGIAGGNRGLTACYFTPGTPSCAPTNGFYPGYLFFGAVVGESDFLQDLNAASGYEGAHRYSIWSTVDQVITGACLVWGRNTCRVPAQTGERVFFAVPFGHLGVRDLTGADQHNMVVNHTVD